jgi:hypothetical protein
VRKWYQYLDVATGSLNINNGTDDVFSILGNGSVGIGAADPDYKLGITGNVSDNDVYPFSVTMRGNNVVSHGVGISFKDGGYTSDNASPELMGAIKVSRVNSQSNWKSTMSFLVNNINYPPSSGSNLTAAMFIDGDGNVGVGTLNPASKFHVAGNLNAEGTIMAKKIKITQTGWSDYVFAKKYKLRSLLSLETFIKLNNHLPEMPSAKQVEREGISVGDTQTLLLKKIEELTLYLIDLNRKNQELNKRIQTLEQRIRN